jgi:hypothetical protein
MDNNKNNKNNIARQLNITKHDLQKISPEDITKLFSMLDDFINMDKTFKTKHETLKTLYKAYLDIHKKNKINNSIGNGNSNTNIQSNPKNESLLRDIHNEMKTNNTDLFRHRLIVLKNIKETPLIDQPIKDKICSGLLAVFKGEPTAEYSQYPMLEPINEKISVNELDNAYLQKHNELMTVYKAYQNLFSKVVEYKDKLDEYKKLPTESIISREQMNKLISDQGFVMNMIDKMQDKLIDKKIISSSEKVPVGSVINNPTNIEFFNDTMRDQIKHIIDRQIEIQPETKRKIEKMINSSSNSNSNSSKIDCKNSNDDFCRTGKKLIVLKSV